MRPHLLLLSFTCLCVAIPQTTQKSYLLADPILLDDASLGVLNEIQNSGLGQIVKFKSSEEFLARSTPQTSENVLPVVQMHGMGDFAENPMGMVPLRKAISKHLGGVYVKNVALGSTFISDMLGSFVEIMDREVDIFAEQVRGDSKLAQGFNAIGYSQGSLTIRGYIEKYNDPPVKNFISMHGILMGVSGFPRCNFTNSICQMFDLFLGDAAYNSLSQHALAQANYYRDPMRIQDYYARSIFLPGLNNEGGVTVNSTYQSNMETLNRLVCVKAERDTMVWPNDSEWWGHYEDGSLKTILTTTETPTYSSNAFGLKTLVESGRYVNLTTPGDHLQFSEEFLLELVDSYFK